MFTRLLVLLALCLPYTYIAFSSWLYSCVKVLRLTDAFHSDPLISDLMTRGTTSVSQTDVSQVRRAIGTYMAYTQAHEETWNPWGVLDLAQQWLQPQSTWNMHIFAGLMCLTTIVSLYLSTIVGFCIATLVFPTGARRVLFGSLTIHRFYRGIALRSCLQVGIVLHLLLLARAPVIEHIFVRSHGGQTWPLSAWPAPHVHWSAFIALWCCLTLVVVAVRTRRAVAHRIATSDPMCMHCGYPAIAVTCPECGRTLPKRDAAAIVIPFSVPLNHRERTILATLGVATCACVTVFLFLDPARNVSFPGFNGQPIAIIPIGCQATITNATASDHSISTISVRPGGEHASASAIDVLHSATIDFKAFARAEDQTPNYVATLRSTYPYYIATSYAEVRHRLDDTLLSGITAGLMTNSLTNRTFVIIQLPWVIDGLRVEPLKP